MADSIHNERVKLTAGVVSNAGLAFIVAGFIAPIVTGHLALGWRLVLALVWIVIGAALHWIARLILGRMQR
jgi:MFS family permease